MWKFYIIKTNTNNYYTGITKNLEMRFKQHQAGHGSNYTQRFNEMELAYYESFATRNQAESREKQVKGWSVAKKQALINQDFSLLKQLSKNSGYVEDITPEG
jgi:putative endonuclease